jgi:hypothetical protein
MKTLNRNAVLTFTEAECDVIIGLIDQACHAKGLLIAPIAHPLAQKIVKDVEVRLDGNDCQALAAVIDVAIQAGGLKAAALALPIMERLRVALQSSLVLPE